MKASETQDRFKRFENVEAVKGTNLEIEEGDRIVLHNGLPFLPTSTDGAAVKAIETPTSTDGAAVKAIETPTSTDGAAVKAIETPTSTDGAAVKAIETKDLVKRFEDVEAVKGINLEIEEGELFGLLGPNGAGKTTTISMLCTIVKPTSGSASVFGHDVKKEPGTVRGMIGIVFQDPSLDDNLTGKENLDFHGRLYKVPRNEIAGENQRRPRAR